MTVEDNQISPDLSIADVMARWPETIPVFIEYQTSCVGCDMAPFESLSDAAKIYGFSLDHFIRDLQVAIQLEP